VKQLSTKEQVCVGKIKYRDILHNSHRIRCVKWLHSHKDVLSDYKTRS